MQPWDRQPFDSDETFRWFVAYRDAIPPRQLRRLSVPGTVKPPLQTLLDWYNQGFWADRAQAWDAHLDQIRQTEREAIVGKDARDAAAKDEEILAEMRALAMRELEKRNQTSAENDAETKIDGALAKWIETMIKLGRLSRGENTEQVGTRIDMSSVPLEDIRKLQEIKRKAGIK